jgi:hypothetical protein
MPFRARSHESALFTHGLTVVLLTAFMLRALIPTGWMPQVSTSGDGVTLVICTVAGLQEITLGADGHPTGDSDQANAGHDPCPFSAVAKFTPPALTPLLIPPTDYGAVEPLRHAPAAPAATHLRLAESRAPPVLS